MAAVIRQGCGEVVTDEELGTSYGFDVAVKAGVARDKAS